MSLDFPQKRDGEFETRLLCCLLVVILFFLLVFSRLFYLQIIRGRYFNAFSSEHTMKEIRKPATRGIIYDRNQIPLAENRPSFDLTVIPQRVSDFEGLKKSLAEVAGIDPALLDTKWKETRHLPPFLPLVIASDISYDQVVKIRVAQSVEEEDENGKDSIDLEGVEIRARPLRSYPQGNLASLTLGYVGEVSEKDLQRFQKESPGRYLLGDLTGISGVERFREGFLKGRDGYEQKIVDAAGREVMSDDFTSFLRQEEALPGEDLVLTLDSRLQKFAEERFQGKSGSLVALDPNNGEILAMVSLPAYDLTALVSNVSRQYWTDLASDPRNLLLNRSIQGTYPPGSTFKIVTAIAGLEEGVIHLDDKISCGGGLQFGKRFFKCWRSGGHGAISVHRAIAESCDTFFYQVGLRLGVDRIAKYARLLGLGQKSGIDLEGEKSGTIPTTEWKKSVFKQEWQPGENLSVAVGQGYDTETPLQNAQMVARVATGKMIRLHLMKTIANEEAKDLPISRKTLEIVRAGMRDAIESEGGTAHGIRSRLFDMAGKTGTAQVMSEEAKGRVHAGVNTRDHAWFIVFAPFENPRIAVSVIVEHGGFGASAAAPIAKDVIEKYFELQKGIKPNG